MNKISLEALSIIIPGIEYIGYLEYNFNKFIFVPNGLCKCRHLRIFFIINSCLQPHLLREFCRALFMRVSVHAWRRIPSHCSDPSKHCFMMGLLVAFTLHWCTCSGRVRWGKLNAASLDVAGFDGFIVIARTQQRFV